MEMHCGVTTSYWRACFPSLSFSGEHTYPMTTKNKSKKPLSNLLYEKSFHISVMDLGETAGKSTESLYCIHNYLWVLSTD